MLCPFSGGKGTAYPLAQLRQCADEIADVPQLGRAAANYQRLTVGAELYWPGVAAERAPCLLAC
jgi:hypothetical protein